MQLDEFLGEGEAETGAFALALVRAADLTELFEDDLLLFG